MKLQDVLKRIFREGGGVNGKILLTAKSDKQVLKVEYKLIEEETTGGGDDKETEETILGRSSLDNPFEIKAGEEKTLEFAFDFALKERLADKGGALGAVGKLGAFASATKQEYYVVAECDVKGAAFDPSDKVKVVIE